MPKPHLRLLGTGQQRLLAFVLVATGFLLANAAYLAFATHVDGVGSHPKDLPVTYQGMLVLHIVVGIAAFAPAVVFAVWHLKSVYRRRTKGAGISGLLVLSLASFLFVSGLFILTAANSRQNLWAFVGHQVAAILLPAAYGLHRYCSKDRPEPIQAWRHAAAITALTLLLVLVHSVERMIRTKSGEGSENRAVIPIPVLPPAPAPAAWARIGINDPFVPFVAVGDVSPESVFFPSPATTTTGGFLPSRIITHDDFPDLEAFERETKEKGFSANQYLGAQTCVRCHQDSVEQWSKSAHRFASFNNPFYRKSVELLRETRDKKASQWCGGCHDPAIMLAGNMPKEIDPLTPEAQAGLTCLACHAIDKIHNQTGNGNYNIQDLAPSPYVFNSKKSGPLREVHDYLLKAKPTVHKREMLQPFFRTSEFCATCHKVSLDVPVNRYRWFRGQNDYDAWHNTGVAHNQPMTWYEPATTKTCQDCHMPLEDAPLGDLAAKNGKIKSHRFLAANTALPHIRGDVETIAKTEAFLRDAKLKVDVFAMRTDDGAVSYALDRSPPIVKPGSFVQIDVVVRNLGVGHTFPGGTNDSNEGWIDFDVSAEGQTLWRNGAIGQDHRVDPAAHFYQVVFVDKMSERIAKRNPADIHAPVYVNVIPPSGSDLARYRFRLPPDQKDGDITVTATLKWRKFNRTFVEFVYEGKAVPELPVTVIASAKATIRVRGGDATSKTPEVPIKDDWTRFNDYGIAMFLDRETKGALDAFAIVARLRPDLADGWRNQARAYLLEGQLTKAEEMLRKASAAAPNEPRTAFFWGQVLAESGRLREAAEAFQNTLKFYPQSRDTWSQLGKVFWENGEFLRSIEAYLEVLRIDPEDALSHYQRSLAYQRLAAGETDPDRRAALEFAAKEAERAFEKYKTDENAATATQKYRLNNEHDNRMSQRIVIHEQENP